MGDNRGMPTSSASPGTAPERQYATRVVLADDDVLLREGLASLLDRSGFDVVGQAGNGTELLALVRSIRPELAIIVLSAHVEVEEAMELLAGGQRLG